MNFKIFTSSSTLERSGVRKIGLKLSENLLLMFNFKWLKAMGLDMSLGFILSGVRAGDFGDFTVENLSGWGDETRIEMSANDGSSLHQLVLPCLFACLWSNTLFSKILTSFFTFFFSFNLKTLGDFSMTEDFEWRMKRNFWWWRVQKR